MTTTNEIRKKAIQDIFSHKYFVEGNCLNCGKHFARCTNSTGINSCCCSDKCTKEIYRKKAKKNKERHHYEVFKDSKYYYIMTDGLFDTRRNFDGKSWHSNSYIENLKREEPLLRNEMFLVLSAKIKIPNDTIKIIDKVSAYLYDKEHIFDEWKKLKGLNFAPNLKRF